MAALGIKGRAGWPEPEAQPARLQEKERRVKDVAYNLKERIRQELAFPAVIHFYTWLLQGVHQPWRSHSYSWVSAAESAAVYELSLEALTE